MAITIEFVMMKNMMTASNVRLRMMEMHFFRSGWARFMNPQLVRASAGYLASSFSYSKNSWMPPSGATFDAILVGRAARPRNALPVGWEPRCWVPALCAPRAGRWDDFALPWQHAGSLLNAPRGLAQLSRAAKPDFAEALLYVILVGRPAVCRPPAGLAVFVYVSAPPA